LLLVIAGVLAAALYVSTEVVYVKPPRESTPK
jgi:hypothetical protein